MRPIFRTAIACVCLASSMPQGYAAEVSLGSSDDPAAAMQASLHALRVNDLATLLTATPAEAQALTSALADGALAHDRFLSDRLDELLREAASPDATAQLIAAWSARVPVSGSADLAAALVALAHPAGAASGAPAPGGPGGPGGPPGMPGPGPRPIDWRMLTGVALTQLLARGLETQQVEAVQQLLDAAARWVVDLDIHDARRAKLASAAAIAAVGDLQVATINDLCQLPISTLITRGSEALVQLKALASAYGVDADAILDSASVADGPALAGHPPVSTVIVSFTAFNVRHQLPLAVVRSDAGTWRLRADSPIPRLLGLRLSLLQALVFSLGPPPGFGPGGPGGGGANRDAGATQPPPPLPRGDNGF